MGRKKTLQIIKKTAIAVLLILSLYICFSFISANFNILFWNIDVRGICGVLMFVILLFYCLSYLDDGALNDRH